MKSRSQRILLVGCFYALVTTIGLHNKGVSLTQQEQDVFHSDDAPKVSLKTSPRPLTTLVHFDPYFMGGFRNQHMRFVAFVSSAVDLNISQILLPSLRWGDHYNKGKSIPHELLFDVRHWNSRATTAGLPLLVDYDPVLLEGIISDSSETTQSVIPCFNLTSGLYSGVDEALLRNPRTNLRRINIWEMLGQGELYSHCRRTWGEDGQNDPAKIREAARRDNSTNRLFRFTHLLPQGGLLGGAGRLWIEYERLQRKRFQKSGPMINGEQLHPEHVAVEMAIFELLRPTQRLREATDDAIKKTMKNSTIPPRLLALHPRVEQEMLVHRCAAHIETRLAKVFQLLETFSAFRDGNSSRSYRFDLLFIAGSTQEIDKISQSGGKVGTIANQNRDTFRHAREHGLFGGSNGNNKTGIPMFESATDRAAKIEFPRIQINSQDGQQSEAYITALDLGVLELVASIIHFWIAVQADIFVGVKGSSYSTDIFSARHYQHKSENYILGPQGIKQLYGPPAPHKC